MLFIPIARILKPVDDTSLSGGFFDSVGGFNVETEDEIFSMVFYSEDAGVRPLFSTSSIAGALFGAVHCLAWHFSFPSHTERILWRTASLGVIGSCAGTLFAAMVFDDYADKGTFRFIATWIGVVLCALATLLYPVFRITLLVLALTSLRSLPPSAFDTVDWVDFVPHI